MNYYRPPLDDIRFLLETFDYDADVHAMAAFEDYDAETCMGLLEAFSVFCMERLLPLNSVGDQHGVKYDAETHDVTVAPGFTEAYKDYCENGFACLSHSPEYGGMGAPFVLSALAQQRLQL